MDETEMRKYWGINGTKSEDLKTRKGLCNKYKSWEKQNRL